MRRTNWQSSRPSVATEIASTMVTDYTDRVVHRGVRISRELSWLGQVISQGRLNEPMERTMWLYTNIRCISFPRNSRAWCAWHDIRHIIIQAKGQGWYSSSRFQLTLGRSQNVDDDHDTLCREVTRECNRRATSPNKRGGGAKGKRCSQLTAT